MGKDSHKKRSQAEAPPPRSRSTQPERPSRSDRRPPGAQSPSVSYSRSSYTPSRLSQVTNSRDISEVDAQTEAFSNLSFGSSTERPRTAPPVHFDSLAAWERQGGKLEELDDGTLKILLNQYIGSRGDRSNRRKFRAPKVAPPPAPILEEEEEEGGVYLGEPSSSTRHKGQGIGRVT